MDAINATLLSSSVTEIMTSMVNNATMTLAAMHSNYTVTTDGNFTTTNETSLNNSITHSAFNPTTTTTSTISGPTTTVSSKEITFLDFEVILPCIFGIFIILSMSMVVFYTKVDEKGQRRQTNRTEEIDRESRGDLQNSGNENGVPPGGQYSHYSYSSTVTNGVIPNGYAY